MLLSSWLGLLPKHSIFNGSLIGNGEFHKAKVIGGLENNVYPLFDSGDCDDLEKFVVVSRKFSYDIPAREGVDGFEDLLCLIVVSGLQDCSLAVEHMSQCFLFGTQLTEATKAGTC